MFSCEFCKIYQNSSFIECLETAGNIFKSQAFYRSLLNLNAHQFIFNFFKKSFLSWVFKVFSSQSIAPARRHQVQRGSCRLPKSSPSQKVFERVGLTYYLHSFRKQPAASVFKNKNCCFPDQGNLGHHTNKFTWPIHQFLMPILWRF